MEQFRAINQNKMRIDVKDKLTGKAAYGADLYMEGMLYAKGVQSRHPHARIRGIDASAALSLPGVACVLTAKDMPGDKVIGEEVQDQFVFSDDRVLGRGDVVALAVAETMELAHQAAALVKVDYEILPAVLDMWEAIDHEQVINPNYPRNICSECHAGIGNVETALAAADAVVDEHYETCLQEHAYIEPEAVLAIPGPREGGVTVKGCLQNIFMPRLSITRCLKIPMNKVTIIAVTSGGSFGGKLESPEVMAVRAALAAIRTGRPVKYVLTREESVEQSYKRHPFSFHVKAGATRDGKITGIYMDSRADGGAYTNMSPGVIFKGVSLGSGPYLIENTYAHSIAVFTNNAVCGSFRGFGNPQAIFARECCLTELAEKLGMSPYLFRRQNILKRGDISGTGQLMDFHDVGALDVLDKVAEALGFEDKYWRYKQENVGKSIRRGAGLSLSHRGNSIGTGLLDVGRAYVEVEADASVLVSIGLTEIGQGLHTVMCQIAAEALGIDADRVSINPADSSRSPVTGACIASRGTIIGGSAVVNAAERIKRILKEAIAKKYTVEADAVVFDNGNFLFGGQSLTFEESVSVCYLCGMTPAANGTYVVPELPFDEKTGEGDTFYQFTYSCIGAEVEVDTCTGQTRVIKVAAAHDIGRAINPKMAMGQMQGGAVMAQGYSLTENLAYNSGKIGHSNFDEYKLPTMLDVSEVIPIIVENPDERGPFGARSLGEPSFDPGAGAFINAVNQALGELGKVRSLPADPERIISLAEAEGCR